MIDSYDRRIEYLRISITDECNSGCIYCAKGRNRRFDPEEILSQDKIANVAEAFMLAGGKKIRLTGGEPLMRDDLEVIISRISSIPGLQDLSVTSNGTLLAGRAKSLRDAGLHRMNISLDTLREDRFTELICPAYGIEQVLNGIQASVDAGFDTIKVNMVVMRNLNDDEIPDFVRFAIERGVTIRFIEYMPFGDYEEWRTRYVPADEMMRMLTDLVDFDRPASPDPASPARYFHLLDANGQVGFISPVSHGFCDHCNRLRLNSNGFLQSCLLSKAGVDLKGASDVSELTDAFLTAVSLKAKKGCFENDKFDMRRVGG